MDKQIDWLTDNVKAKLPIQFEFRWTGYDYIYSIVKCVLYYGHGLMDINLTYRNFSRHEIGCKNVDITLKSGLWQRFRDI